jgi:hypothetical protein
MKTAEGTNLYAFWGRGAGTRVGTRVGTRAIAFGVVAVGLITAFALSRSHSSAPEVPSRPSTLSMPTQPKLSQAALDTSRFILNALLVPVLDSDATPLRWVDPIANAKCGANTTVQINGRTLVVGALVPNEPFELAWQADRCRPFGAAGPQFDGAVRLTIYREEWGFSAMVHPTDLRITSNSGRTTYVQPRGATVPQCNEGDLPNTFASFADGGQASCS